MLNNKGVWQEWRSNAYHDTTFIPIYPRTSAELLFAFDSFLKLLFLQFFPLILSSDNIFTMGKNVVSTPLLSLLL